MIFYYDLTYASGNPAMGSGTAGTERLPRRLGQGPAPARGGGQGDQPGHGRQDQGKEKDPL